MSETSADRAPRGSPASWFGLVLSLAAALAVLAALPALSAAVLSSREWLLTILADASAVDLATIGTAWLGMPFVLALIYVLTLRPLR